MKNRFFLTRALIALSAVYFASCVEKELPILDPTVDHEFVITGMKESLGFFEIENGRIDSIPEGINNLSIIIANEDLEQVYQNNYYGYDYWDLYQSIPDSIWIPTFVTGVSMVSLTFDGESLICIPSFQNRELSGIQNQPLG